ncbi:N-acetylmuramoyl-L-alanine amidase (plasmid) [Leptolyngbya sp. NIES-3755]|nr:N-acetylmuramoyl-L-alanine amidase [Leptolyngbya sp. NIES-3755]
MAWLRLTKTALYLMKSGDACYVDKVNLTGEKRNQVRIPTKWFTGNDAPGAMVIEDIEPPACSISGGSPSTPTTRPLTGKKVVLDPGHGEDGDKGAISGGRTEAGETLKQARLIQGILQARGASVTIVENTRNLSLDQIGALGAGADCFVSVHLNSFNQTVQGHEVLIDRNGTDADLRFATAISQELDRSLDIPNRGVKRQGLAVLRAVPLPVPAVLVESFFLDATPTNQVDEWIQKSAQAIARGIEQFLT